MWTEHVSTFYILSCTMYNVQHTCLCWREKRCIVFYTLWPQTCSSSSFFPFSWSLSCLVVWSKKTKNEKRKQKVKSSPLLSLFSPLILLSFKRKMKNVRTCFPFFSRFYACNIYNVQCTMHSTYSRLISTKKSDENVLIFFLVLYIKVLYQESSIKDQE